MTTDSATLDPVSPTNAEAAKFAGPSAASDQSDDPGRTRFARVCRGFIRYHTRPINVALHCLTTPMAIVGTYVIACWFHPAALVVLAVSHAVWIVALTPLLVCLSSTAAIAAMATTAWYVSSNPWLGLALFLTGYLGQEASHWISGEATFQSSYRSSRHRLLEFIDHTVLLLPLLIVSATRRKSSPLRILVARQAVLQTRLSPEDYRADFDAILNWVRERTPTLESSTHWWQHDLEGEAGEAFNRLSSDPTLFRTITRFHGAGYEVKPALGMNEVYVTGPPKKVSSDTVFYMGHVDGPWAVFPGATLYRCMLALNENLEVTTHFSMAGLSSEEPVSLRLCHGDAALFDFNRELHYITRESNPCQPEPRINLKLHFVAYPKTMRWYGGLLEWLTTTYDIQARNLFLQTIQPNGWIAGVKARWVLSWTRIFEGMVQHVGWTNLAYVGLVGAVSGVLWLNGFADAFALFVAATSFVHYGIYVGTLLERRSVAFARFRRDAMFFKVLSMGLFLTFYATNILVGGVSGLEILSVIVVCLGFSLAGWAAQVLGMTRTLYSSELGLEPPMRIQRAPFGYISHPMILGAAIAISATGMVNEFRERFGWLILGHLVCYAIVLAQEIRVDRSFEKSQETSQTAGQ
ncbi:hypothetical protein LOC67_19795 [Stieleria sp. JC731]|uniref:methyltransferase n=1 Tax=Pirellulaceae TaxID=2691357 RepID=UPI001E498EFB|nr:methyltransferase [Stieleria sp. JC731]MCC9602800.1 hypothetical protein [Stieleria sp. JC731]